MASASFREQMNSLGWSRRAEDEPVNTSQQTGLLSSLQSLNPFGDRGYVRLPTTEGAGAPLPAPSRREEEEGWFTCESMMLVQTPFRPQSPDPFLQKPADHVNVSLGPLPLEASYLETSREYGTYNCPGFFFHPLFLAVCLR